MNTLIRHHLYRLIAALLLATLSCAAATAHQFTDETLHYKVSYKWGLIHKNAGTATMALRVKGNSATATLYARTDPWADKFYNLRDTLITTFNTSTLKPSVYHRIAHEDGRYAHDIVKFSFAGTHASANCTRYRRGKGEKEITTSTASLSAEGMAVDMLSVFYYIRALQFDRMSQQQVTRLTIFSGKKKETLTITYKGLEKIKLDGKQHDTYHLTFTFTSDSGKKSSDPIDAWISADSRHIPLKLEGSLKIGKVRCFYTGG